MCVFTFNFEVEFNRRKELWGLVWRVVVDCEKFAGIVKRINNSKHTNTAGVSWDKQTSAEVTSPESLHWSHFVGVTGVIPVKSPKSPAAVTPPFWLKIFEQLNYAGYKLWIMLIRAIGVKHVSVFGGCLHLAETAKTVRQIKSLNTSPRSSSSVERCGKTTGGDCFRSLRRCEEILGDTRRYTGAQPTGWQTAEVSHLMTSWTSQGRPRRITGELELLVNRLAC